MKIMLLTFPLDPLCPIQDLQTHYRVRYLQDLVSTVEQFGWSVDVYTGHSEPAMIAEEPFGEKSRIIRLPLKKGGGLSKAEIYTYWPNYLKQIKDWVRCKDVKYTLIQSNHWYAGWFGRQLQHEWGIPHIHTPFDLGADQLTALELNRYSPLAQRIMEETRTLSTADVVVAAYADEREVIWRKYGLRSIDVQTIPYGIDTKLFYAGPAAERMRGKRVVLYTGGFNEKGGLRLLVDAVQQLLIERPRLGRTIELWALGDPPMPTHLMQMNSGQTEQLDRFLQYKGLVRFLGKPAPAQMAEYYRAADICFVPTAEDGFGIAALEAMACGCPIVGPRTNRLRHIILDGETGLLARSHTGNVLAQALERLATNTALRKRMGKRAAAWVQESFNLYSVGKLWDNLYREVIYRHEQIAECPLSQKQEIIC